LIVNIGAHFPLSRDFFLVPTSESPRCWCDALRQEWPFRSFMSCSPLSNFFHPAQTNQSMTWFASSEILG
jgi:hypothetical protein